MEVHFWNKLWRKKSWKHGARSQKWGAHSFLQMWLFSQAESDTCEWRRRNVLLQCKDVENRGSRGKKTVNVTFGTFRPKLAKPTVQFRTQPKDNSSTLLRIFSLVSFCTFPLKTLAMFVIIKHHCKRVIYAGLGSPLPPIIFHDLKFFDLTGLVVCELTRN